MPPLLGAGVEKRSRHPLGRHLEARTCTYPDMGPGGFRATSSATIMNNNSAPGVLSIGKYELWFVAQLTMGIVFVGGAMFVMPLFALSLEGATPGDVGVVMAVLPLIGLSAPIVGGLLDRYGSFLLFQLIGLGAFAVGFVLLALADEARCSSWQPVGSQTTT